MEPSSFVFIGNHFITDFVNTRINKKGVRTELLHSMVDVLQWLEQAGKRRYVSGELDELPPARQTEMFEQILAFRNLLEQTFAGLHREKLIPAAFIEHINKELVGYSGYYQFETAMPPFLITRHYTISQFPALFLEEAALFLTTMKFDNLKKCENPECILYFYDTSRNQQRRWCSMEACGNRVKVNQHYYRKKQENITLNSLNN